MTVHSKHVIFLLTTLFVLVSILTAIHLWTNLGKVPVEIATIVTGGGVELEVELAQTYPERRKGLSERSSMGSVDGMLFIHPDIDFHNYWMKDMEFDLDIIWILEGVIVDIKANLEPEEPPETLYAPEMPANMVLELKAGKAEDLGLRTGQKLDISFSDE